MKMAKDKESEQQEGFQHGDRKKEMIRKTSLEI